MKLLKPISWFSVLALITVSVSSLTLADDSAQSKKDVLEILKKLEASTYAHKQDYGRGIDSMTIGYDESGEIVAGVAVRETKTYKKITTILVLTPQKDGGYLIKEASSPNVGKIPGTGGDLAEEALRKITGIALEDEKAAKNMLDAVTSATKYYKAIYVSYALMASSVIKEISDKPDWKKQPMP